MNTPSTPEPAPHYHMDKDGRIVKCYKGMRAVFFNWQFWLGMTLSFPFEHALYTYVWPFYLLSHWLGLDQHH